MQTTSHFISILSDDGIILYTSSQAPALATLSLISVINSSAKSQKHLITRVDNLSILDLDVCTVIFGILPFYISDSLVSKTSLKLSSENRYPERRDIDNDKQSVEKKSEMESEMKTISFDDETLKHIIIALRKIIGRLMECFLGTMSKWDSIPQLQFQRRLQLLTNPFNQVLTLNTSIASSIQLILDARCGLRRFILSNQEKWTGMPKNLLPKGVIEWAITKNKSFACGSCKRKIIHILNNYNGEIGTGKDIPVVLRREEQWGDSELIPQLNDTMVSARLLIITLWKDVNLLLLCGESPSLSQAISYISGRRRSWDFLSSQFLSLEETSSQYRDRLNLVEDLLAMIYISVNEDYYMFEDFQSSNFKQESETIHSSEYLSEMLTIFISNIDSSEVERLIVDVSTFSIVYIRNENGIWCACFRMSESFPSDDETLLSIGMLTLHSIKEIYQQFDKLNT